jgi:hypothetical protein
VEQARRWRFKAEECRVLAQACLTSLAHDTWIQIAQTYEQAAARLEGAGQRLAELRAHLRH